MDVLLVSPDLMIQSRAAAAAARAGIPTPQVTTHQEAASLAEPASFGMVLLDLTSPGLDVREWVPSLRKRLASTTRIVAFGPHVQKAKLDAAREAGCDLVISRGQFDRDIDAILQTAAERG